MGDEGTLVVEDGGGWPADGVGPEVAELAEGRAVEGAGLHGGGAEFAEASAKFTGGFRGEGEGEHVAGFVDAGVEPVGDAVCDGAGLAGTCAREDGDWADELQGGLALLLVEPGEE